MLKFFDTRQHFHKNNQRLIHRIKKVNGNFIFKYYELVTTIEDGPCRL